MSKAPKISLAERSLVLSTAHAYRRETGLDWSTCQIAAWDALDVKRFNDAYEAWKATQVAAGNSYDEAHAFFNHPNPYRRPLTVLNSAKVLRQRRAADAVFHAQMDAKYRKAA